MPQLSRYSGFPPCLPPIAPKENLSSTCSSCEVPQEQNRGRVGSVVLEVLAHKHGRKQAGHRAAPRRGLQSSCCTRDLTSNIVNAFLITHKPFCSERIIKMIKNPPSLVSLHFVFLFINPKAFKTLSLLSELNH